MSNDPFSIQVPNFATVGLSDAVNAIVAALVPKKFGATSTNAAAGAQSLAELVEKLRATRTTHPATTSRTDSPSDFMSVQLPMSGGSNGGDGRGNGRGGGAVLSDAEVAELAGQRAASNVSATDVRSEIAALEKRMAYVRAEIQGGRRGPTETAGFQKELESLNESRLVAELTLQRVAERDAARRAKALKDDEIAAAEHEFINGDPKRREAYERAKLDYEARNFAEWVTLKKLEKPEGPEKPDR